MKKSIRNVAALAALLTGCAATNVQYDAKTVENNKAATASASGNKDLSSVEKLIFQLEDVKERLPASPEVTRKFRKWNGLSVPKSGGHVPSNFYFAPEDASCSVAVIDAAYLPESEKVGGAEYVIQINMGCGPYNEAKMGDFLTANVGFGMEPVITMGFPTKYWETGKTGSCVRRISADVGDDYKSGLFDRAVQEMSGLVDSLEPVEGTVNYSVPQDKKYSICEDLENFSLKQ